MLNADSPRNSAYPSVGLYIELKNFDDYLIRYGFNQADLLFDILSTNGLGSLPEDGSDLEIPIIIQSFEFTAVEYWRTISDLPTVFLFGWDTIQDWSKITETVNGVGPSSTWLMHPFDPSKLDGGASSASDSDPLTYPAQIVDYFHSNDVALHPYTL